MRLDGWTSRRAARRSILVRSSGEMRVATMSADGGSPWLWRLLSGPNEGAKLGANVSRCRAASGVVRRLSLQVGAT